jgi:uncharacterized protein YbaP (TraB family)
VTGRRRLASALLAILALAGCQRAPDQPPPSPALWEVTGTHGEHGYLFGTIHALPGGIRWHTPRLDAAFAASGTLAVEARDLDSPRAMNAIFERLARSEGLPPLGARVPAGDRALVERLLGSQGLSDADFADVETWAAALTLANARQPGESANGVDRALLKDAVGKQVIEFEGVEPQLRIFDALPQPEQADLLVAVAREASTGPGTRRQEVRDWLTGKIDALAHEADAGVLADPELRAVLLVARNRAWTERIDTALKRSDTLFVAVGAAHLPGPDGLAALLAARGYTVRRIQ